MIYFSTVSLYMIHGEKILITGCSGFIAHHIIPACQKHGFFVIGVDKRPIPEGHAKPDVFIHTDVRDLGFRDLLGVHGVIHLAFATSIPNSLRYPEQTTEENIGMTLHLLEIAKDTQIKKFLFPSTASLYSNNPTPWKETMMPEASEPYSWQKLSCESLCRMYTETYHVPTVVFRFFQVFGEFQREDTAIATFIRLKKAGKPVTLTKTRPESEFRSSQRDFIYAGDIAEAVVAAIESEKTGNGEIINIATGKTNTMEEVAHAMNMAIEWIPRREYEVERHHGDIRRAKECLGWSPQMDIIQWLQSYDYQK